MGKFNSSLFTIFALSLFFTACQTSPLRTFDSEVKVGMDKNNVLAVMGTPNTSGRFHGKDRWIYVMYEDDVRFRKEVHFEDGHAVYVGNEYVPPKEKQAATVDQVNLDEEVVLQGEEKQRVSDIGNQLNKYEDDIKGKNSVIYVPEFQPIK
jgi:outer membrane protein assembly factor BamE